jgi:hypothetical protein
VLFKKATSSRYVGDGKVDVIQFHSSLRRYIKRRCAGGAYGSW